MNHATDNLQIVVRQIDLARPDLPMKVSKRGQLLTLAYRFARCSQQKEDSGAEHVHHLTH